MSLQPIFIAGLNAGLENDKKPFLLPDQAWQMLNNAYCWRERILKREGITFRGRLRRAPTFAPFNVTFTAPGPKGINLINRLGLDATAEIEPGNITPIVITYNGQTLTDSTGTGVFTIAPAGNITAATINYATGVISVTFTATEGPFAMSVSLAYYPSLPVMGILQRTVLGIEQDQTIFFDTTYAYIFQGTSFQEFLPLTVTTWAATDSNFFWGTNYRGVTPNIRLFFVTNFQNDGNNPMRYTDGSNWFTFDPLVDANDNLFNARILIPYYGRLLALNVWEGTTAGGPTKAINIFNRCRFSAIGDPTAANAWRSDIFGQGGFIDAPTNEDIISAIFYKNTLIVGFENSTWQLRYVGEYGLPFIWERISSDFGMESTFASVLFDDGVIAVGDRAITQSTSNNVKRIDLQVPDTVYAFSNVQNGPLRVQSVRDFQKELIYWTLPSQRTSTITYKFPDQLLLYNYRNNTYAVFRENVTALGFSDNFITTSETATWDSTDITWDDEVLWDDTTNQSNFPEICLGNQQGFIHTLNDGVLPGPSLSITGVVITAGPSSVTLTIENHNLEPGEFIYLTGLLFLTSGGAPTTTNLNNAIFSVYAVIDMNTIQISQWNGFSYVTNFSVTPDPTASYVGGGHVTLIWQLLAQTKDFNPYQKIGKQYFLSYIDFQTDATPTAVFTVNLNLNSSNGLQGNALVGNQEIETFAFSQFGITGATNANPCVITSVGSNIENGTQIFIQGVGGMTQLNNNTFVVTAIDVDHFSLNGINSTAFGTYTAGGNWIAGSSRYYVADDDSQYAWHRFYATVTGQYLNLGLTYSDDLMNNIATHNQTWELNAMSLWMRPAGRLNF